MKLKNECDPYYKLFMCILDAYKVGLLQCDNLWVELSLAKLGEVELIWFSCVKLSWLELCCIYLGGVELGCVQLSWVELS